MTQESNQLITCVKSLDVRGGKLVRKRLSKNWQREEHNHWLTGPAIRECTFFRVVCRIANLTRAPPALNNGRDGTTSQCDGSFLRVTWVVGDAIK
jgi:hypothetical protein